MLTQKVTRVHTHTQRPRRSCLSGSFYGSAEICRGALLTKHAEDNSALIETQQQKDCKILLVYPKC